MKSNDLFVIKNFSLFINATRSLVFSSFGKKENQNTDIDNLSLSPEEQEELDTVLSYNESHAIAKEFVRKQINKITSEERYLMSEATYYKFVDALNHRMIGNLLNGLVNKGMIETSFDSEANDFVFWVKDNDNENPETN